MQNDFLNTFCEIRVYLSRVALDEVRLRECPAPPWELLCIPPLPCTLPGARALPRLRVEG